ncbi:lipase [Nakamurella flavida]|uniref:Lipase n=1 Tax=Nakamurella flavida TaxID=363630 RepID=A0A938YLE5_9ACTN|nr:lipase [Nakamurella flavida]
MIRGAVAVETTPNGLLPHRLPDWVRARSLDDQLAMAESQPSGVRVVLRTAATLIRLTTLRTTVVYPGAPPRLAGTYALFVDGRPAGQASGSGGRQLVVDLRTGGRTVVDGPPAEVTFPVLPTGDKDVEIWLPHTETTELLELTTDAPVGPAGADTGPRWVHHGSSISQGSNADSPAGTWPALTARAAGLSLLNLGFGGSALLDPFVARTIAAQEADLISVKIGINLVNTDLMRLRAFVPAVDGFLDAIRDAHPTTPLVVISPLWCPIHEDTPGPGAIDPASWGSGQILFTATGDPAEVAAGKLTLTVIREQLAAVVGRRRSTDPHLHLVDGRDLYGPADHETDPLPDRLHPSPASHRLIADRFRSVVAGLVGS